MTELTLRAGRPICNFCSRPLQKLGDAYLEIYNADTGGYPDRSSPVVAYLAHAECGPDAGYAIDLRRLLSHGIGDEPTSWLIHLSRKSWWDASLARDLQRAHATAHFIANRAESVSIKTARNMSPRTRARILERDGFTCRRCGSTSAHARLVVDHIVPIARGGSNDDGNLQTLCEPCNQGKADRAPHPHDLEGLV